MENGTTRNSYTRDRPWKQLEGEDITTDAIATLQARISLARRKDVPAS
jgi:hypothetical protein